MADTTTEVAKNDDSSRRYAAAVKALKAAHNAEFLALLEAEYEKDGAVYKRRLTPEERAARDVEEKKAKAAAKIAALQAEFPDLATVGVPVGTPEPVAEAPVA